MRPTKKPEKTPTEAEQRTRDFRINAPPNVVAKLLMKGGAAPRIETRKRC